MVAVAVDGNGVIVVILTVWAILNAVGGLGRGKGEASKCRESVQ